jgi:hypothetical protein
MVYYLVLPCPCPCRVHPSNSEVQYSFPLISKEENMAEIASSNHTSLSLSPSVF